MRKLLEPMIESEAFQALLAHPGPRLARAEVPGHGYVVAALAETLEAPVMAVAPGPREADRVARGAAAFLGDEQVALFPAWEALPGEGISPSPEIAARRAEAAHRARRAKGAFVLAMPVVAAVQRVVPSIGERDPLRVRSGQEIAPDGLAELLVDLGYARTDLVMHRGEFALRGGIIDVFPGTRSRPVRLEFLGDDVERIREFAPSSQISTGPVDAIAVYPV
ncbi:MAG TPA: hypothetical protein VE915_01855, partial [Actinomycetota bacterium]|nr:hypothetical protein [Actinomycetota bacterium]